MGGFDISDGITEGLGGESVGAPEVGGPASQRWDCSIGGLPFLFAISAERPMQRQTAAFRRERIDTERSPGEQSLDSGVWTRSWASMHLGAGLQSAEPLEVDEKEARFRVQEAEAMDLSTPGRVRLQPYVNTMRSGGVVGHVRQVAAAGSQTALFSENTSLYSIQTFGSYTATTITTGSTGVIHSTITSGSNWYISASGDGVYTGALATGAGAKVWNTLGTRSRLAWVKNRLMAAGEASLYELTGAGPALPAAKFTHPSAGWEWTGIVEGPEAIYVSGYQPSFYVPSAIYRIDATESGGSLVLGVPRVVAEFGRTEQVLSMYTHLGSYLIIGTTKGVRVASINTDGSITVGPCLRTGDYTRPVYNIDGDDRFIYLACNLVGSGGGEGVGRQGVMVLDMSRNLDNNPLAFPIYDGPVTPFSFMGTTNHDVAVVNSNGSSIVVWTSNDGMLGTSLTARALEGFVTLGGIRLGTDEPKAWRSIRMATAADHVGTITVLVSTTGLDDPINWTVVGSITAADSHVDLSLAEILTSPTPVIYVGLWFENPDSDATGPVLTSVSVSAMPAPNRTELVRVPLMMFDHEQDRQGARYGKEGGSFARYQQLKNLEGSSSLVTWRDYTTGEVADAYVEEVSLQRTAAPSNQKPAPGGVCTVTLRLV